MHHFSPSASDSNEPVRALQNNHVSSDKEDYFCNVMECLAVAYGDQYSKLSNFEIKCLSLRFCQYYYYDILECLKQEFGCSAVDVYKVYKNGQLMLTRAFPTNDKIPKEGHDAVNDAYNAKSNKSPLGLLTRRFIN